MADEGERLRDAVRRDRGDREASAVWLDWLEAEGDPLVEVIRAEIDGMYGIELALRYAPHVERLLGPLAGVIEAARIELGRIVVARRIAEPTPEELQTPEWRAIEHQVGGPGVPEHLLPVALWDEAPEKRWLCWDPDREEIVVATAGSGETTQLDEAVPPDPVEVGAGWAARGSVGLTRAVDEDGFGVEDDLYFVLDGMGGQNSGELATRLVREALLGSRAPLAERLEQARGEMFGGVGASAVIAELEPGWVNLTWIGDCRAYRIDSEGIELLTQDHTLVQRLVELGRVSAAEATTHPHRNILLRLVAADHDLEIETRRVALGADELLLLCTDGVYDVLSMEQLRFCCAGRPPEEAVRRLFDVALVRSEDNLTALVVQGRA